MKMGANQPRKPAGVPAHRQQAPMAHAEADIDLAPNPTVARDGDKFWWQHGKLHRDDGPAEEYADGGRYWYQHGKRIPHEEA